MMRCASPGEKGEGGWSHLNALNGHYRNAAAFRTVGSKSLNIKQGAGGSRYQWEGEDCCCARSGTFLFDSSTDLSC